MTRLLLSLLRLLAENRSAAQAAARGRSTGQYRRLVPAPAHAGYGPMRGYRHPDPARGRYAYSTARHMYDDRHYDHGLDDADAYRGADEHGHTDGYEPADGSGYQDDHGPGDSYGDAGYDEGARNESRADQDSTVAYAAAGLGLAGADGHASGASESVGHGYDAAYSGAAGTHRSAGDRVGHGPDAEGLWPFGAGSSSAGAGRHAGGTGRFAADGGNHAAGSESVRPAGSRRRRDSAAVIDREGQAAGVSAAVPGRPDLDDVGQAADSVRPRAAGRGSPAASARVRGGGGHSGSASPGVGAGASAAGAASYQRRGRGAPSAAAAGSRAGRSGASGGGGRSRLGGGAARGAGVLPPGASYDTEPFATEPFGPEAFAGGQPLTGTVHRPERGGRGPGSGWGGGSGWGSGGRRPRRRWIPLRYKWIAALVILGLIFRRAVAWAVLFALSAAFHLVGVGIHLPSIKFGWPWQSVSSSSTTTTPVGPWVLQKIEGISKPALGRVNFNFVFTRKVSKSIGPWPCWYQSTFAAVGHASATVTLNPGSAWWAPGTGHYRLRVLSAPQGGKPGHLSVQMMLPMPQLPQSAHDVTIDDLPSKPIDVQHSWTYPGFGCGTLLKPQFDNSVLYAQAQQIAFYKSTHVPQVTKPLVAAAEAEAVQTVRDNFVQPTVNALGYTLDKFSIAWVSR